MLGDLINSIRTFWIQHIKCRHKYNVKTRATINQVFEIKECEWCGRTKVREI